MMKSCFKRRGFTLISILIVIAIITILAAMMFMSSSEAIATARATAIIANLNTLKKAVTQWYMDNREKVQPDGRVKIGSEIKPVQQWKDSELHISSYLSAAGGSGIQIAAAVAKYDPKLHNTSTNIPEGCYGICDGGTVTTETSPGQWEETEYHRNVWYVGYCFTKGEDKVRDKIKGRIRTTGVFLETSDAHQNTVSNQDTAVWLRVF